MNSLPKTCQRRGCDLNPGPTAPESSMLTTWLCFKYCYNCLSVYMLDATGVGSQSS